LFLNLVCQIPAQRPDKDHHTGKPPIVQQKYGNLSGGKGDFLPFCSFRTVKTPDEKKVKEEKPRILNLFQNPVGFETLCYFVREVTYIRRDIEAGADCSALGGNGQSLFSGRPRHE
jgi:hypothetical protein